MDNVLPHLTLYAKEKLVSNPNDVRLVTDKRPYIKALKLTHTLVMSECMRRLISWIIFVFDLEPIILI